VITRIELDGFKTFQDFTLDLGPFQVIVGANGAGKSNLFDALRLLSRLADADLRTAFQDLRGEAGELFTVLPDGSIVTQMHMAVEMLVDRQVRDSWGAEEELRHTRMRYELTIERRDDERGLERLYVVRESLTALRRETDRWIQRHLRPQRERWLPALRRGRQEPFISTEERGGTTTINLHQDGHGGRKASVAEKVERTVLSGVSNTEFPHAFAAREEMRAWGFLQLNPQVLREPSPMLSQPFVAPDGSNLPNALARMRATDPYQLNDVSRDLANLVPGLIAVEVEEDQPRNRYIIRAETEDGRSFSSRVLSDGTLRMLVLVTLKNDPQHHGVLCFEEPENGVHPFRLERMAQVLRDLATDFNDPDQADEPLRQLLVNTHSPAFIRQAVILPHLLFAHMVTHIQPGTEKQPLRVTRIVPIDTNLQMRWALGLDEPERAYTVEQIIHYLSSADSNEAIAHLREQVSS
jgi:predicted ATPase